MVISRNLKLGRGYRKKCYGGVNMLEAQIYIKNRKKQKQIRGCLLSTKEFFTPLKK